MAVADHKYRIEVGYGLEGILPDGKTGDIGRDMVPDLKAGDYDGAVTLAVGEVAQVIADDAKITLNQDEPAAPPSQPVSAQGIPVSENHSHYSSCWYSSAAARCCACSSAPACSLAAGAAAVGVAARARAEDLAVVAFGGGGGGGGGFGGFGGGGGGFGGGGAGGSW